MSQMPYSPQDPSANRPPVISGELVGPGTVDPGVRSYAPLGQVAPPQHPHPAALQPYGPPPGPYAAAPGYVPMPVVPTKSVGVAFLLTFFFGPFGMFYSTVSGALILLGITFGLSVLAGLVVGLITLVTFGFGAVLTFLAPLAGIPVWITSMIWGCLAASSHNERVRTQYAYAASSVHAAATAGYRPAGY